MVESSFDVVDLTLSTTLRLSSLLYDTSLAVILKYKTK